MTQYFPLAQKMATLAQEALFFLLEKLSLKHLITRKREEVRIDCVKNDRDESLIRMAAMRNKTRRWKKRLIIPALLLVSFCVVFSYVSHAEEYTYNDDGQVTQVTHDDGSVTVYEYDKNGNLIQTRTISPAQKAPSGADGKNTEEAGKDQEDDKDKTGKKTEDKEKKTETTENLSDDREKDESDGKENMTEEQNDKGDTAEGDSDAKEETSESESDLTTTEHRSEAVDESSDDGNPSGNDKDSPDKGGNLPDGNDATGNNATTGDPFPLALVVIVLAVAVLGTGVVLVLKRKNRQ